jgi:predicted Zn-dependent protease
MLEDVTMRRTLILALVCLVSASIELQASDSPCQVHLILFVPADVDPPNGYQQRIDQIVDYSESFFRRELKRWGHEQVVMPFRRTADGHTEVTVMRGKMNAAAYKPVSVRMEVMDAKRQNNELSDERQVWWILTYKGSRPTTPLFLGGVGREIGGWAVCNLDLASGPVNPTAQLGSDFLTRLMLKGTLHELGHGFGLPHIGPLRRDNAGNTLMGPTHENFRGVTSRHEERIYLSEAEAAILSAHPAFRGINDNAGPLPKIDVQNMKYAAIARNKSFVVSGRLSSDRRAVYALVADESDARPGEYWTKTYVGEVNSTGDFEVVVFEPSESNGTLKLWFVFSDGSQTGDGKTSSRESGIAKAYTYRNNQWTFD